MKICCATDDGQKFTANHFGDAKKYYIYEISKDGFDFIKSIDNVSVEEKVHADPNKAKSIVKIISEEARITLSNVYGPNIKRICKFVLPIIVKSQTIEEGIKVVIKNYEKIEELSKEEGIYYNIDTEHIYKV